MRLAHIDPANLREVATFHGIYVEVGRFDNPDGFVASPVEEIAECLRAPTDRFSFAAFLGWAGEEAVASGWAAADVKDDARLIHLLPRVLPGHRQAGLGSAMLELMEEYATRLGRTLFHSTGVWDASHGPDGVGSAPVEFAAKHGWKLGLTSTRFRLLLPTRTERLDALGAERKARRQGYTIRAWSGPVPDELLSDWALLEARLSEDAPRGSLASRTETASTEAVRDDERILARTGRVKFNAVAISPGGELVAYSNVIVRAATSEPGFQWGTFVRREHRGRGLGAAVKIAALGLLERSRPDVPAVITENARSNRHMIRLNQALGCVPVLYSGQFQKHAA